MNNQNLFLTVLEARKSRIKALAYLVSGEVLAGCPLGAFSHDRRGEGDFWGLFFRSTHLFEDITS